MNQIAYDYAMTHIGVPYVWGGDNRFKGLDCGGLVSEVLRSQGLVSPYEDLNTRGLWDRFATLPEVPPSRGAILFFSPLPNKPLSHVAIALDGSLMIEAGGGDSSFGEDRIKVGKGPGAMVRVRPIKHPRRDLHLLKAVMPPWPK